MSSGCPVYEFLIRISILNPHPDWHCSVSQSARKAFRSLADDKEWADAYFEYVKTDVLVPIVDFASLTSTSLAAPSSSSGGLSKVAIQGNLEQYRRDYNGTFENLLEAFAGTDHHSLLRSHVIT